MSYNSQSFLVRRIHLTHALRYLLDHHEQRTMETTSNNSATEPNVDKDDPTYCEPNTSICSHAAVRSHWYFAAVFYSLFGGTTCHLIECPKFFWSYPFCSWKREGHSYPIIPLLNFPRHPRSPWMKCQNLIWWKTFSLHRCTRGYPPIRLYFTSLIGNEKQKSATRCTNGMA